VFRTHMKTKLHICYIYSGGGGRRGMRHNNGIATCKKKKKKKKPKPQNQKLKIQTKPK
jgi:hypothetical protein